MAEYLKSKYKLDGIVRPAERMFRNSHGIKIKMACCSCIHCGYGESEGYRVCKLRNGQLYKENRHVGILDVCDEWIMQPKYHNAGKGNGQIRGDRMYHLKKIDDFYAARDNKKAEAQAMIEKAKKILGADGGDTDK